MDDPPEIPFFIKDFKNRISVGEEMKQAKCWRVLV